jgi:septal ring factor EnvC (AmiA/AmiB activator)
MYTVITENGNEAVDWQAIQGQLDAIRSYMEKELVTKQHILERQEDEIVRWKAIIAEKDALNLRLENQLQQSQQTNEGTRQLINKLLNDISNYQKDIEWYKRTYVKRSLLGTVWQKLIHK